MAKARAERTKSKASLIEDLTHGIERLQEFIPQIEDLGREGFPYLEGARARTELQLRECIRKLFGEKSPEFQHYKQHKLSMESPADTKKSVSYIRTLIAAIEDKKQELLGLKPPPQVEPPATPPAPAPRPQMTLVPPVAPIAPMVANPSTIPTAQVTLTSVAPVQPPPVTMSIALSTNLDLQKPSSPVAPPPAQVAPAPVVQETPAPPPVTLHSNPQVTQSATPPPSVIRTTPPIPVSVPVPAVAAQPASPQKVASPPPTISPILGSEAMLSTPAAPPAPEPVPMREMPSPSTEPQTRNAGAPAPLASERQEQSEPPKVETAPPLALQVAAIPSSPAHPVETVKTLCRRFHLVARQLRLRGEYRATLDVEDEFDVQDLLHALLRLHFDDIETDEWAPSYTNGSPRTMFLLNDGRLAVVVKKTRTGLNVKDLSEQLRIDADHCRTLKRCSTLLCFVYDPEGRIGNPRGLEADLISISDQLTADIFVAPK
jgi:hypothetical protein